ncbi:hypothetical protein OHD28_14955 [Escherichia coli]|nr:hypothetical protein [Escherichia coli]
MAWIIRRSAPYPGPLKGMSSSKSIGIPPPFPEAGDGELPAKRT